MSEYIFKQQRQVVFSETDSAGIVHFSNFFRFMEDTEHAFFRSLGFSIDMVWEGKKLGWPRVNVHCDYRKPLRFEENFEVFLRIKEVKQKSIEYHFTFENEKKEKVAEGSIVAVCVEFTETNELQAVPIPEKLRALFLQKGN